MATTRLFRRAEVSDRLHVGCGSLILPGWINVDLESQPGVDHVLDVRRGLPFENLRYVFAEHFLEHLTEEEGKAFLRECRRILAPAGALRLSTPNLDWVMVTHYNWQERDPATRIEQCRILNRAFHGWGHQFLYNDTLLERALRDAGFDRVEFRPYGKSGDPELRGLERHEIYPDWGTLQHVLIAEAR
jgi:predicted SAM-dependent methyltransferase